MEQKKDKKPESDPMETTVVAVFVVVFVVVVAFLPASDCVKVFLSGLLHVSGR